MLGGETLIVPSFLACSLSCSKCFRDRQAVACKVKVLALILPVECNKYEIELSGYHIENDVFTLEKEGRQIKKEF